MTDNDGLKQTMLHVYTRTPDPDNYPPLLACSAHFAVSHEDGSGLVPLNQNYGILFAKADTGADNTIQAKGLAKPLAFKTSGGGYALAAIRVNDYGGDDPESRGCFILWQTRDFCSFRETGLIRLHRDEYIDALSCRYDRSEKQYVIRWRGRSGAGYCNTMPGLDDPGSISEAVAADVVINEEGTTGLRGVQNISSIVIDDRLYAGLLKAWTPIYNVAIQTPETINASSAEELEAVKVKAVYSDGSTAEKKVRWNTDTIDFDKPGEYRISGIVENEHFRFPLAKGYGDPVIYPKSGSYYFISTNDNLNDIGLYVRESDSVAGLFGENIREQLILGMDEARGLVQTFWAPEFHTIGDDLYILFAVSGKKWGPQCHIMRYNGNSPLTDPAGWDEPVRIKKKDGTFLADSAITLDMTYFKTGGKSYYVWSYRENIGTDLDSGSMLFIAETDEKRPWSLTSEPVLLSRPLLGWENVNHTINNEGPYPLITDKFVHITYSGGSANSYTYALGLLTADKDRDLLDPENWIKNCAPVLSFYSVENEYGPGHNSFYKNRNGGTMIAYHAEESLTSNVRCPAIRRVHFNKDGIPVFNMSAERDLNPVFRLVKTVLRT